MDWRRILPRDFRDVVALVRAWRGKGYARFAGLMLAGGVALTGTSIVNLISQRLPGAANSSNEAPWWIATGVGVALIAGAIWLFVAFHRRDPDNRKPSPPVTEGAVAFSVPEGIAFEACAALLGKANGHIVQLKDFTAEELATALRGHTLQCPSLEEALAELGALAGAPGVRAYAITAEGQRLILQARSA